MAFFPHMHHLSKKKQQQKKHYLSLEICWPFLCVWPVCVCMVVHEYVRFLCSTLTQRSVTQPCIGQVLGDSFAEIESLGMPEHFCEDELLFILNTDKR